MNFLTRTVTAASDMINATIDIKSGGGTIAVCSVVNLDYQYEFHKVI